MHHFISTLVAVLPLAAAAPFSVSTRDANAGCQDASFGDFAWSVEDFDYHASYTFTTPAHQVSGGFVNFNLTNPALEYKAECTAYSTQLSDFFYGTMDYSCTVPEGTSAKTTFAFSRPSGQLDVNQSWTCSDADPQYPTTFRASGSVKLDLTCTDETTENPDWQMGETYSSRIVTCDLVTVPLEPSEITAVA